MANITQNNAFFRLETVIHLGNSIPGQNKWLTLVIFFFSIIYLWKRKNRNYPPGPWNVPFVGYLGFFKVKFHVTLTNLKDKYGDVLSFTVGKYNTVVVNSFQGIFEGLHMSKIELSGRPDYYSSNAMFFGERQKGVSTADLDDKTEAMREYIQECLDLYCTSDGALILEQKIKEEATSLICYMLDLSEEQTTFDPSECFQFAHFHIMLSLLYNEPCDPGDQAVDEIFKTLTMRFDTHQKAFCDHFPFFKAFYREHFNEMKDRTKALLKLQREVLNRHKDTYDPHELRDMTDHLLLFIENDRDYGHIDNKDMDFLMLSVLESGFADVPALLSWLIGYMVAFPDIQDHVYQELSRVVGKDRFPNLSDQVHLPFTSAVILEVQRIVTIHPFLLPHKTTKKCVFQGYDIPKDTILLFNIWSVHHDKRHFRNPMKFDPWRFLGEDGLLKTPDYFLPYGIGRRRCPGESLVDVEAFLFFSILIHQLQFSSVTQHLNLEADYKHIMCHKPFSISVKARDLL